MGKEKVNLGAAKTEKYLQLLHEIEQEGVCPFCPAHFKWHPKPILKQKGRWCITESFAQDSPARRHFIIVGDCHKENLPELTSADWAEISHLANWAIKKFKIKGGGLAVRFGDTRYSGSSVSHIHAHLIEPEVKGAMTKPVRFAIG